MLRSRFNLSLSYLSFIALGILVACNPGPGPYPGLGNNQQIYEEWQMSELIRVGCFDANNNYRRPCTDCPLLVMDTDNSYQLIAEDKTLIQQGTFTLVGENDIVFDPSIFTNSSVTKTRFTLIKGALSFLYTDMGTDCSVTESYLVSSSNVAGD